MQISNQKISTDKSLDFYLNKMFLKNKFKKIASNLFCE